MDINLHSSGPTAAGLHHIFIVTNDYHVLTQRNIMPRRPRPTALRLVTGPTPSRYQLKHVLPSIPLPTFHPHHVCESNSLHVHTLTQTIERHQRMTHRELPPQQIQFRSGAGSGNTTPDSAGIIEGPRTKRVIKGPWNHSGSITLKFDVEKVLAPLKPVVVGPGIGHASNC